MGWELVIREDYFEGSNAPFISVSNSHFGFNAAFVRQAELEPASRVTVYVDGGNRKIGFEFHKDDRSNSFSLSAARGTKKGEKRKSLQCAATGIVRKYPWIESVTREDPKNRRFPPKKEAEKWVIQLCPAFEERRARESEDIPSDAVGVYRYIREGGAIVYIGRGPVKSRLHSPERSAWDFDVVEYSIVYDPDDQVKWEDYWIEKFKDRNGGELPFYNKVSGASKYRDK
ncbi:MAG: hypothetical protein K9N10_11210 [Deltaproteobacteria bacterium]|nr:hypothetical protein [Deltaproteobacteria bacterium]